MVAQARGVEFKCDPLNDALYPAEYDRALWALYDVAMRLGYETVAAFNADCARYPAEVEARIGAL